MLPGTCLTLCCVAGIASRLLRLTGEKDSLLQPRKSGSPCPMGLLPNGQDLLCNSHLSLLLGICLCRRRKRDRFVSSQVMYTSGFPVGFTRHAQPVAEEHFLKFWKRKKDDPNSYFIQSVDSTKNEKKKKKIGLGCTEHILCWFPSRRSTVQS